MTGKELVKWIEENKAEGHVVIAVPSDYRYLRVVDVWEGEKDGGAIMLRVAEEDETVTYEKETEEDGDGGDAAPVDYQSGADRFDPVRWKW